MLAQLGQAGRGVNHVASMTIVAHTAMRGVASSLTLPVALFIACAARTHVYWCVCLSLRNAAGFPQYTSVHVHVTAPHTAAPSRTRIGHANGRVIGRVIGHVIGHVIGPEGALRRKLRGCVQLPEARGGVPPEIGLYRASISGILSIYGNNW